MNGHSNLVLLVTLKFVFLHARATIYVLALTVISALTLLLHPMFTHAVNIRPPKGEMLLACLDTMLLGITSLRTSSSIGTDVSWVVYQ